LKICQVLAAFPYREQLTGEVSGGRYRGGGIGRYVLCLSGELARMGHRVTVVAPGRRSTVGFRRLRLKDWKLYGFRPSPVSIAAPCRWASSAA